MEMGDFKKIIAAKGLENLVGIIFDNSMRWYFDDKERTENITTTVKIHNAEYSDINYVPDPSENLTPEEAEYLKHRKEGTTKRDSVSPYKYKLKKVKDCFKIEDGINCVSRKVFLPGSDPYDPKEKRYYWDVAHVENIQKLIFGDSENIDYIRANFDLTAT